MTNNNTRTLAFQISEELFQRIKTHLERETQMVGSQAAMNLYTGERYKVLSNESRNYLRGMYGRPAGPIEPTIQARALDGDRVPDERPGSLLEPGWEKAKEASKEYARCDEDILTYALFPDQAEKFFQDRQAKEENVATYTITEA